jgi:hypothetical protein
LRPTRQMKSRESSLRIPSPPSLIPVTKSADIAGPKLPSHISTVSFFAPRPKPQMSHEMM